MLPSQNGSKWSREEMILAFNLYCQIPFGKIHSHNPQIIKLAEMLGRTPSSISLRLSNFASHDPALQARGVVGMRGGGNQVGAIWDEFANDPERLAYESERLLAGRLGKSVECLAEIKPEDLPSDLAGAEREAMVKVRVNQNFFRKRILSAYNFRCCVTGLSVQPLLVASHIIPWAADPKNRLNPRNGLCLNALHDRAFDRGLMWVDESFTVRFSPKLKPESKAEDKTFEWLTSFAGRLLIVPKHFSPDPELLIQHMNTQCLSSKKKNR
jgi:putative restriction endonuclease